MFKSFKVGYLFALYILMSCGLESRSKNNMPITIDSSELLFDKGDCLQFKMDSITYGVGVVFDFSKDETGTWYCLLLTDYESTSKPTLDSIFTKRFLGRKISNSLSSTGFEYGIDSEYILDSLLMGNFSFVGNLILNEKVKIGARGASSDMNGLVHALKDGKLRRLRPPDNYREHLTKLDGFRPEEYFNIIDFVER